MLFLLLLFLVQTVISSQVMVYHVPTGSVESPLYFNYKHAETTISESIRKNIDPFLSNEIKESGYSIICYESLNHCYIATQDGTVYYNPNGKKSFGLYQPQQNDDRISVIKDFWTQKESDTPNLTFNRTLACTWHYKKFLHCHLLKDKRFSKKFFLIGLSYKTEMINNLNENDVTQLIKRWLKFVSIKEDLIKDIDDKYNFNSDEQVEELYKTLFSDDSIITDDLPEDSISSNKSTVYTIIRNRYIQSIVCLFFLSLAAIQIKKHL